MPSFDLFKYFKTPLAFSEDSLPGKLHHEQTEGLLGEEQLPDWQKYDQLQWKTITLRACEIVVILVCILMFALGLRWQLNANQYCLELHSFYCRHFQETYPKDFEALSENFNGSLTWPSPYRGHPSPEIDAEWEKLEGLYPGSSTLEEVLLSGGTADDVRLPEKLGGGYMTSFEVIHQLHCLNLIRKATYYDYYKDKAIEFTDKPKTARLHIGDFNFFPFYPTPALFLAYLKDLSADSKEKDHCIEMTRQNIMCHADVGLMSNHWIKDYPRPYANFNTWHKCRNFDEVLNLAYKHQVPTPLPDNYTWPIIEGSKIWDDAPQPGEWEGMIEGFGS